MFLPVILFAGRGLSRSDKVKELIARYAPQIVLVILTAVVYKLVEILFGRRSKVVFYLSEVATFTYTYSGARQRVLLNTLTITLQNLGRAPAEDVQIVHYWLPENYTISPPMQSRKISLPEGQEAIVLDRILPRQTVTISYLYSTAPPNKSRVHSYVSTQDHIAKQIEVGLSRRRPKWIVLLRQGLMLLGAGSAFYGLYKIAVWILRLLAR